MMQALRTTSRGARISADTTQNFDASSGKHAASEPKSGRANAVRDYLVSIGVDPMKLEAVAAADANPIADNSTQEGRAMNRRVEIEVTGLEK